MSRIKSFYLDLLLIPLIFFKKTGELLLYTCFLIFSVFFYLTGLFSTPFILLFVFIKKISEYLAETIFRIFRVILKRPKKKKKAIKLSEIKRKSNKNNIIKQGFLNSILLKIKFFLLGILAAVIILSIYQLNYFASNLPNPSEIKQSGFPTTTKIFDRKGILLYDIYESYNRTPVQLKDIPEHVIKATIATEDKEFFLHYGFSLRGITRAVIHNLTNDNLVGGSTITQQLIRSTYLTPEKTFIRKIREIILSIWIEQLYTKNEILEMYLNQIPYGGTAWGIEAAAQTYFSKSGKDLNLAEAAFLAGLPAAPTKYSPLSEGKNYKIRQAEVLIKMKQEGLISEEEYQEAVNFPLNLTQPRTPIAAPHFVMYVRQLLNKFYGTKLTETGGLRVFTTLDLSLNEKIQEIVSQEIANLKQLNVNNGAVLVTNPKNGEILSMVGSADYFDTFNDGNVNVTLALRQPGSSIKVVNYAAALQNGFTAASIIADTPVIFRTDGQLPYKPVNYDGKYHGSVSLRTALASSYNIPAVKVLNAIGIEKMIETGKKMGIDSWDDKSRFGLSLTLGGGEVTMLDLAEVYGTLSNYGEKYELTPFIKITDYKGKNIPLPKRNNKIRAIPEGVAFIISSILSDNRSRTPAFGSNSALYIPGRTVAVKTGTSDNKRDNWTIGYTDDITTTVWVGNNDNSPMNQQLVSGVTGAAPIWRDVMKMILAEEEDIPFKIPDDLIQVKCHGVTEYFLKESYTDRSCIKDYPKNETASSE